MKALGIKLINMPKPTREKGIKKMSETEKFKLKDILYGLVVPILVAVLILLFPIVLRPALDAWFPPPNMTTGDPGSSWAFLTAIFTHGFAMMALFAVPLILGLIWNKWAGGAAGFIMGSFYYVAFAGYNVMWSMINFGVNSTPNLFADPSFIGGYIVGGILVGYIAGALNNKSFSFKRMLGASLTATITVGLMQFILNLYFSFTKYMFDVYDANGVLLYTDWFKAFYLAMLPMIILGIIAPIIAKVFTWYGLMPGGHS